MYVLLSFFVVFFFKQKTAYEMRISDWSSDVCSSDLPQLGVQERRPESVARSVRGEGLYRARLAQSLWRRGAHPRADQGLQTGNEAHPCALAARQLRYLDARPRAAARSEARRVGKACVSPCSTRWSPYP